MNHTESFYITSQIRMFLRIVPDNFSHIILHGNLVYNTLNHDVIQISSRAMTSTPPKKLLDLAGFDL